MREDIQKLFGDKTKEQLLEIISEVADMVDTAEEAEVILDIQEALGQERH